MKHRITLAVALVGTTAMASAQWTTVHRDASHNAVVAGPATVGLVARTPTWQSNAENLTDARVLVLGGLAIAVAATDGGTPFTGGDDTARLRAFNTATGARVWESAVLDPLGSVANGSVSSPVIDATERRVYYGVGSTVTKLNLDTGATVWSSDVDSTSTAPGRAFEVVNSSPALGSGKVFIQTTTFGGTPSQVVAFDTTTGAVVWSRATGGLGVTAPLHAELTGGARRVFVDTATGSNAGMQALDADTGAVVWNSLTLSSPWSLPGAGFNGIWADVVLVGGKLIGLSYDFSANGNLFCVDAATGSATGTGNFIVAAAGSDCPPFVVDGVVFNFGGGFGAAELRRFDATSGALLGTAALGGGFFRNYIAATSDRLFLAQTGRGIQMFDIDGNPVDANASIASSSPVSLGEDGSVYLIAGGRLVKFGPAPASAEGWLQYD